MDKHYLYFKYEGLWCILQTTQLSVENEHHSQDEQQVYYNIVVPNKMQLSEVLVHLCLS